MQGAPIESILPMPLSPGDKLGPCEILSTIGEGGMGSVYKARERSISASNAKPEPLRH